MVGLGGAADDEEDEVFAAELELDVVGFGGTAAEDEEEDELFAAALELDAFSGPAADDEDELFPALLIETLVLIEVDVVVTGTIEEDGPLVEVRVSVLTMVL